MDFLVFGMWSSDQIKTHVVIRDTDLNVRFNIKTDEFETLSRILVHNSARNKLIFADLTKELNAGKRVVVLTVIILIRCIISEAILRNSCIEWWWFWSNSKFQMEDIYPAKCLETDWWRVGSNPYERTPGFLENAPANFSRILHACSDSEKGFVLWRDLPEERLV